MGSRIKSKKIVLGVLGSLVIGVLVSTIFIKNNLNKKNEISDLINISSLSEEFIDNYLEEVSQIKEEDKDNILIVTSKDKLSDTYGAINVIKSPNNQYILQYETKEDKKEALNNFNNEENSSISISENIVHEISEDTVLVSSYNSWGVEAMSIDTLLEDIENYELNDVTVAIIDTGLDVELFNQNYPNRLAGVYNVLTSNEEMTDEEGHGTHIAGTIAESTSSNVKILPVKVSKTKYMYESDIVAAINYITYNKNADVMNMSFGAYGYPNAEYVAIEAAKQKNIISMAAAGNDNLSDLHYPSAFDNTISIAAVDSDKEKADFSNYGESIMFTAPGVDILSINGTMSGTSMATPHAASAVALLKSLNKDLTFDDSITLLRRYSDDLGDISWDEYYGYGFINFEVAEICDGTDCDEYNVFKKSERDNLENIIESYEIEPILTTYNYGSVNNILNSKIIIKYTNGKSIEYQLYNIKNLEMSNYDPYSLDKQTINIKFTTSLGIEIDDNFEITNPASYESVWEYNILEDNNIELTNFKDDTLKANELYVPSEIDGYTVVAIGNGEHTVFANTWDAFVNVRKLYLPSTLTKIGNNAFAGASTNGLNYVKSEAEYLEVGNSAFTSSRSLTSIDANISYVGDYAFYWVDQLANINFSNKLTYIGTQAFSYGLNNAKIVIPESVTEIGEKAFYYSGLREIEILANIEKISDSMFETYSEEIYNQLEKVTLPEGLKEIGNNAFKGRNKLKAINLPESLTTIGTSAFESGLNGAILVIPQNVTQIGENAFYKSGLKEITFLNTIEKISDFMFLDNKILEKVRLPKTVKEIGKRAFENCKKLSEINLPDSLTTIGLQAFSGAFDKEADVDLVIPKNVTTIGNIAFETTGLKSVEFLNNMEVVPYGLFRNSTNLEEVILPEIVTEIGKYAFQNCEKLKTINIPDTLTTIEEQAFTGAFDKEVGISLIIPQNVTSIGIKAFAATGIKEITFKNDIEKVPDNMFTSSLVEKIVLPETVIEIGNYSFSNCSKLKEINLSESLVTIGNNAFAGSFDKEEELSLVIPQNVTQLGEMIFTLSNLKEIIFLNKIDSLPYGTFNNSESLEKIIFQSVPTEMDDYAFVKCINLKSISFGQVAEIGQKLSEIALPEYFEWMDETYTITGNNNEKLYAKFVPYYYDPMENIEILIEISGLKIYFHSNNDEEQELVQIVKESTDSKLNLNTFTKEGYTFKGWNTKVDGTGTSYTDGQEINISKDLNLYAQWEPIKYTITFNANGGTGSMEEQKLSEGNLNLNTFTKEGYKFVGWNTASDGSGTSYTDGQQITISKDITLYAIWEAEFEYIINKYTVDDTNKYIDKIDINTNVDIFKNNIKLNTGYSLDIDYKTIDGENLLYTGSKTKIYNNQKLIIEYTNIIRGEVTGDGKINYLDYVNVYNHIYKTKHPESTKKALENEYLVAADMSDDKKITYLDYVKIYNKIKELKGGSN